MQKYTTIVGFLAVCILLLQYSRRFYYYPVMVSVELKSSSANEACQLFYTNSMLGFNEKQSLTEKYRATKEFVTVSFHLPAPGIRQLRIDPGMSSWFYEIRQVAIQVGEQAIRWHGQEIMNHFELVNLKLADPAESPYLLLQQVESPDAQMILARPVGDMFDLVNTKARKNWHVAIAVFFLSGVVLIVFRGRMIWTGVQQAEKLISRALSFDETTLQLKEYYSKNSMLIVASLLLAMIAYGYELFNFTLSIDDELYSFRQASETTEYILLGRWGIYFLNFLLSPQSLLPYFPTLITIVCLAVASFLFVNSEKASTSAKLVFSILFITHPAHAHYMAFNIISLYVGLGMVMTVGSFLLFRRSAEGSRVLNRFTMLAVILLALALSLYQAMLSFFVVLGVYHLATSCINREVRLREMIRQSVLLAIVIIAAYLLYKAGDLATRYLVLGPASIGKTDYLDNFVAWGTTPVRHVVRNLAYITVDYLSGSSFYSGLSAKTLWLSLPIMAYVVIRKSAKKREKLLMLMLAGMLVVAPFTVIYLNGAHLPVRTLFSLPLMIGMLYMLGYSHASSWLRKLLFLIAVVILINNTWVNTRLFYASYVSWQADRDMANRIIERIYELELPEDKQQIRTTFVGGYQHPDNILFIQSDIFGTSFFGIHYGNPERIDALFKTAGINELDVIPFERLDQLNEHVYRMPSWPAKGSVAFIDGIAVVKLSEPVDIN